MCVAARPTLKGRVACELKTTLDELILTETVCTGLLHSLNAAEIAGLLSLFVAKGKANKQQSLPNGLKDAMDRLKALAGRLAAKQLEAGVLESSTDLGSGTQCAGADAYVCTVLNESMVEAAFHWANGASFDGLRDHTTLAEGDIVRIISRLEELCKEVRSAARLLGDALLGRKLDSVLLAIKRDVVAAPSLYMDGDMGCVQ